MQEGLSVTSLLVGGGQDYYGPTADRDRRVVKETAQLLNMWCMSGTHVHVVTGGTAGIPDEFAAHFNGPVVDIVSSEYLDTYKERTFLHPRAYWVAGETQEKRRLAFLKNPDIKVGLFIQGGQYTTHEIKLFEESGRKAIVFWGSGGASGGKIPYKGWSYTKPERSEPRAYDSTDPDANVKEIAHDLVEDIFKAIKGE